MFAKIGSDTFLGLIMIAIFWDVGSLTEKTEYFNMSGLIFFMVVGLF